MPLLGEVLAVLAALVWSTGIVLFKRSEAVSPLAINLFKNTSTIVLLILTMIVMGQPIDWQRSAQDWWLLLLSGVLGIGLADTLVFTALRRLGASLLAVVDCVYAPILVILSVLFLGEEPSLGFVLGAVLVVGGLLIATTEDLRDATPSPTRGKGKLAGVIIGITGIAVMGIGVLAVKPILERSSLVEVTLIRLCAGVAGQLVWIGLVPGQRGALAVLRPSPVWRTLVPASFLSTYMGLLFWLGGFKWTAASTASVLNQLSSVFTIVLASIFLGEPISGRRAAGAALAFVGALLVLMAAA